MDYQNREGGRTGSGGLLSQSETNAARRERMRKLAMETIDLSKDPYFMKNHLGSFECRLCLTLHVNEGSYLAHTQGKKHSANLARRAKRESRQAAFNFGGAVEQAQASLALLRAEAVAAAKSKASVAANKPAVPRGVKPECRITPVMDSVTAYKGCRILLHYPQLLSSHGPQHRFVSAWEQKVEVPDKDWQYVVVRAPPPYDTVAIKIPANVEMDTGNSEVHYSHWDPDNKLYTIQILFKTS